MPSRLEKTERTVEIDVPAWERFCKVMSVEPYPPGGLKESENEIYPFIFHLVEKLRHGALVYIDSEQNEVHVVNKPDRK